MSAPDVSLPSGATDCHFHVFDHRFAQLQGRNRGAATVGEYQDFRRSLGLTRGVIVAPSSYGYDNSCLLDALRQLGQRDFRAVVIPPRDPAALDWEGLHAQGVRGLRLYTSHDDFPDAQALRRVAGQAAEWGWHLQLVGEIDREPFPELADLLASLPCAIALDHFGFAPQPNAARSRTADAMRMLLDTGRTYVKLSGMYIQSRHALGAYADFDELARELVQRAPDRMLWGSDWPHTLAREKPDGAKLLACLVRWTPDPTVRQRILVDNPRDLYWRDE